MSYTVGDRVQWTSQSGGFAATKTGEVVVVVPAETESGAVAPLTGYNLTTLGYSTSRNHESYLVAVPDKAQPGHTRPRLYWPRVSHLQPASVEATSDELARLGGDVAQLACEATELAAERTALRQENERLQAELAEAQDLLEHATRFEFKTGHAFFTCSSAEAVARTRELAGEGEQ